MVVNASRCLSKTGRRLLCSSVCSRDGIGRLFAVLACSCFSLIAKSARPCLYSKSVVLAFQMPKAVSLS